jgi:hypothetical protein
MERSEIRVHRCVQSPGLRCAQPGYELRGARLSGLAERFRNQRIDA